MPATIISDTRGMIHAAGSGLTIMNDVKIMGSATFLGGVNGISGDSASRFANVGMSTGVVDYLCEGNVRYFRHDSPPTENWTVNFSGLSLQNSQGATIKVAVTGAELIECYIEDVLIDGNAVTSFNTSSMHGIKVKKGGKIGIITFDIMKTATGNVHVYAEISQDLVS